MSNCLERQETIPKNLVQAELDLLVVAFTRLLRELRELQTRVSQWRPDQLVLCRDGDHSYHWECRGNRTQDFATKGEAVEAEGLGLLEWRPRE